MSDDPAAPIAPRSEPTPPPPDRARIDAAPAPARRDLWPVLYLVGFIVLAGALYWLWQNPPQARLAQQDASRVQSMQEQIDALRADLGKLQQRPVAAPDDLGALRQQLAALQARPAANEGDLASLRTRIAALESRPGTSPSDLLGLQQQLKTLTDQSADALRLSGRIDALEKRPTLDPAALDARLATLDRRTSDLGDQIRAQQAKIDGQAQSIQTRLDAQQATLQAKLDELDREQKALAARAQLTARLGGAATALAAGEKLGPIPGAPPALARFANQPPPTEASLRAAFDHYAAAAQQANMPATTQNGSFLSGLWSRAQTAVTVRQGEHVLVGDPIAGTLAAAREQLDTGTLQGAVAALKSLTGPAAQAMQPWIDQAQSLLDARAALASMAAG